MLYKGNLTITHALRNDEADFSSALSELAFIKRIVDGGKNQLGDAIQLITLDGDRLSHLYILDGRGAADAGQRNGDVNRCCKTRGRVERDSTRNSVSGNSHVDRLAIVSHLERNISHSREVDA